MFANFQSTPFRFILVSFGVLAVFRVHFSEACQVITVEDYEKYALDTLPRGLREFLRGGTGNEETLNGNTAAFSKFKVLSRYLQNVSNSSTKVTILGKEFSMPIGISPSGLHKRWTPEGELATVRASAQAGVIMIVSTAASIDFEEIAAASPEAEKWLQLYICRNRNITMDLVHQAERLNFGALVVTVDMPVPSLRYHNIRTNHKDIHQMVNWEKYANHSDPAGRRRDDATWEDLEILVKSTKLPVFVKGIVTGEDAKLAKSHGARGIIISNHGGRQIDGGISSIDALDMMSQTSPELLQDDSFDIYLDSGVRSGLDVFRALALGAKYVFIGRAPVWGLIHSGQQGVENIFKLFQNELQTVMNQAGCANIPCIFQDPRRVVKL